MSWPVSMCLRAPAMRPEGSTGPAGSYVPWGPVGEADLRWRNWTVFGASFSAAEVSPSTVRFTAVDRFRVPAFLKGLMSPLLTATDRHIKEEGVNLERLLEQPTPSRRGRMGASEASPISNAEV